MFWIGKKTRVMTAEELETAIAEGRSPVIVDVRSESDFRQGHLPGAINIPFEQLEDRRAELDPGAPTVFY